MRGLDESDLRTFEKSVSSFASRDAVAQMATRDLWKSMADLGWSTLAVSEASGGLDGGTTAIAIVARNLGEQILETPFLSTGVAASIILDKAQGESSDPGHVAALLDDVMRGDAIVGVAIDEIFADPAFVQLQLGGTAGKPEISGCSSIVCDASIADHLLVPASRSDGGIDICLVPAGAKGVTIDPASRSIDGRRIHTVTFDACDQVCSLGCASAAIEEAGVALRLALSAEAIGIMVALNRMTSDYLKIRRQFGVPLVSFQVLQHRIVDMAIEEQQSIALVRRACSMADAETDDAPRMALAARIFTARAVRRVAEEAVQLHGGVGMTEELVVGHYLKRALVVSAMLGGIDEALGLLARQPQRPWYGDVPPLDRTPEASNPTPVSSELAAITR